MIPQAAIERYLKIKGYAEQGTDGEQRNARKLMQKMEVEWPGIDRQAAQPAPEPFSVPEPRGPSLGFWEAARDAVDLMAGRANAPEVFFKYAQELEEQRRLESQRQIPRLVKLTRQQARSLVESLCQPFISETMFGGLKITSSFNPHETRYWEFYAQDPDNRGLLCEEFGSVMTRAMAEFMATP